MRLIRVSDGWWEVRWPDSDVTMPEIEGTLDDVYLWYENVCRAMSLPPVRIDDETGEFADLEEREISEIQTDLGSMFQKPKDALF